KLRLAGHKDWRLPTIKELYSLIDFNGNSHGRPPVPYIDTRFFAFRFGDPASGERLIDSQYWSSTEYVGLTMRGDATVFGVNFADGRIKGYPRDTGPRGRPAEHFVRYVRGNPDYGKNRFVSGKDGTISDLATGLMWAQADSGKPLDWEESLAYCESLELAGHSDWRLPNIKELHSIVDYTRAPDARNRTSIGPAIDPVFGMSHPEAWFWSGTTHLEGGRIQGAFAAYIAFGRATGMPRRHRGGSRAINVHGAGAQRSDPKSGDPNSPQWSHGMGPQGDEIRILNYARAVRSIDPNSIRRARPDTTPLPPSAPPGRGPPPGGRPPPPR
ncbi:MAG: Lcl C-terminal domain-containing protein, partial [Planctomycetota bacterium]